MEMAIAKPGSVRLLDYTALYWPPWNPWGVAQIYRAPRCMLPQSIGLHLWETKMWSSLLGRLQPEAVRKRDTCFMRLAAAVLDDTYDFSSATLRDDEPAEVIDTLVREHTLADLLDDAPTGESDVGPARPAELAKFRRGAPDGGGGSDGGCADLDDSCGGWAAAGECAKNAPFMQEKCRQACRWC